MFGPLWQTAPGEIRVVKQLLSADQLAVGVEELASQISRDYAGRQLTIVGVLTGSVVVLADLIRLLDLPLRLGLVQARSYEGQTTTPSTLRINADMLPDISGRDVLLVDDIFDTGRTLLELISQLDEMRPASIRSAVLLEKEGRCEVSVRPNYVAFKIPDKFVVGYGLDYNDLYRNLPYVAVLEDGDLRASEG